MSNKGKTSVDVTQGNIIKQRTLGNNLKSLFFGGDDGS